jgi:uncharacterized membrane protein
MSATSSTNAWVRSAGPRISDGGPRFTREVGTDAAGQPILEWRLARNCSLAPSRCIAVLASLAALAFGIAALAWMFGATLVLPFAGIETLALGVALVAYARHAADRDRVTLEAGRLSVERVDGTRTERFDFDAAWVRVERRPDGRSLIELSGDGRRVCIGRFVRPELRDALARELRLAVLQSRPH